MSEVNIEKKEGGVPWWAWLLGALLLAALIWYATAAMSAKPGVVPVAVGTDNSAMVAEVDNSAMAAENVVEADGNAAMMADGNMAMSDTNSAMASDAEPPVSSSNAAMMSDENRAMADTPSDTVPAASTDKAITNILSIVDNKSPETLYNKNVQLLGAPVQTAGTKAFWIGPSFEQKMLVVTDEGTDMNGIAGGVAQRDRVDIQGQIEEIKDFDDAKTKYDLDDSAITFLTNKKILLRATSVKIDKN